MYMRPPATAGVLCVSSPSSFLASRLNRSDASTTTTSPRVEIQNSRPSTQTGDPKKSPPTLSCQLISPEAAFTQLTIPPSPHKKSKSPTQILVGTYGAERRIV